MKGNICIKVILLIIFFGYSNSNSQQYILRDAYPNLSFTSITEMVSSNDGTNRIFVTQQRGLIYVFPNDSSVISPKVFLNISDRVTQTGYTPGLLGIAFHPNYLNNRYFFVFYTTEQTPLRTIIARYTTSPTNPDSALKSSELIIMTIPREIPVNNAGKIAFGPDGFLYMGIGYGGPGGDPENVAQNRTSLLGKILRINIDSSAGGNNYSIPPTNPFYGNSQGWRQEIFTWGMRNPWKFSFDLPTNRLWAGDPGQGAWEEIDIIQNGKNYGWRMWEGYSCYWPPCDTAGMTFPIWVYSHTEGCVIVGGYVYRGTNIPGLVGKYIYADHCSGKIWALNWDGINPPTNQLLLSASFLISSFGIDQNNNLYVCQYATSGGGKIYRIISVPVGIEPVSSEIPSTFSLSQNYPNPFNPATKIQFALPTNSFAKIVIYDALGKEIETIVNEQLNAGTYEADFDGSKLSSGVYYYKLTAGDYVESKKMLMIK